MLHSGNQLVATFAGESSGAGQVAHRLFISSFSLKTICCCCCWEFFFVKIKKILIKLQRKHVGFKPTDALTCLSLTILCRLTEEVVAPAEAHISSPFLSSVHDAVERWGNLSDGRGGHLKRREGDREAWAAATAQLNLLVCHVVMARWGIIKIYTSGAPAALAWLWYHNTRCHKENAVS